MLHRKNIYKKLTILCYTNILERKSQFGGVKNEAYNFCFG